MVRLSDPDFSRLFDITSINDIFGLHALHDEEGGDPYNSGCLHDAVADILTGDEPCNDVIKAQLTKRGDMIVDRLTAQFLRLNGIRPAAACALATTIQKGIRIEDYHSHDSLAYIDDLASAEDPSSLTSVWLSKNVRWNQDGSICVPPIPETMLGQLEKQPLIKLVSHPLLDPMKLVIENINQSPIWPWDPLRVDLKTGYKIQKISLEELMEI